MRVATQVSVVGCGYWDQRLSPVAIALQGQGPTHEEARSEPQEIATGRVFDGDQDGGDTRDLVQSGRSRGKSWCSGYTTVHIDYHQLKREAGLAGLLGLPQLWSISRRGQLKHLVLSRLSWNPSPSSMPNIRFILTLYLKTFSDDYIPRKLLPSKTRSEYFAHASPRSRNFSRSPRVMRRKKHSVKDY
jgi:hypothetical protein